MITGETLRRIAGAKAVTPLMTKLADAFNSQAATYGVTEKGDIARFLSNVAVETGGFRLLEENLNYSAERLHEVWPKRFPTVESARPYAKNPKALANKVYGSRLGNAGRPDAGWNYRGSGALQTTGYDNFLEVEKATGLPVTQNPDLLRDPVTGMKAALLYWKKRRLSKVTDLAANRKGVNGGHHGLDEMKAYYARAIKLELSVPDRAAAPEPAPSAQDKPAPAPKPQEVKERAPEPATAPAKRPPAPGALAAAIAALSAFGFWLGSQFWSAVCSIPILNQLFERCMP